MTKAYEQHMKDGDFPMILSHARPFLLINAVSLPKTTSSFPGTLPFPELHPERSAVPTESSHTCPMRDRD